MATFLASLIATASLLPVQWLLCGLLDLPATSGPQKAERLSRQLLTTAGRSLCLLSDITEDGVDEVIVECSCDPSTRFLIDGFTGGYLSPIPHGHPFLDFDNDRIPDLLSSSGIVSSATGAPLRTDELPFPNAALGRSLIVSDRNADGVRDYVVQVKDPEKPALLIRSGVDGQILEYLPTPAAKHLDGNRPLLLPIKRLVGDLDCDGHPDILVGTGYCGYKDRSAVLSSATGNCLLEIFSGKEQIVLRSSAAEHTLPRPGHKSAEYEYSWLMLAIPDLNEDGVDEFVLGTFCKGYEDYLDDERDRGQVLLFCGRTLQPLWQPRGSRAFATCSTALELAPDQDRDGLPDILVGLGSASSWASHDRYSPAVILLSTRTGKELQRLRHPGELVGTSIVSLKVPGELPWTVTGGSFFQGAHFQDMPGLITSFRADGSIAWSTSGPELEAAWQADPVQSLTE